MNEFDNLFLGEHLDSLILINTFEKRAWCSLEYLYSKNNHPSKILVLDYKDRQINNYINSFTDISFESYELAPDYSVADINLLRRIDSFVADSVSVGIDISAIPIPLFFQIINFLKRKRQQKKLVVLYTEPKYYYLDNLFDYKSLIGEVCFKTIPGFEGKIAKIDEQKHIVFYILGFEMEYISRRIPIDINSEITIPINGFPSFAPKYKDISLINNNVNYHEIDVPIHYAPANNPFELYNQLLYLKERYSDYCIDIIPAGSKPMALGACLFSIENSNYGIRVLYPFPSEFSEDYGKGKGKTWEYHI